MKSNQTNGLVSFITLIVGFLLISSTLFAQAIRVEVKLNERGEYRLYRGGTEHYIKGGGGSEQWDELAKIGGNSVRTWSTDNAKEMLDKAHSLGLTVMMGLWMQHERHGFDYDDKPKVQAQLDYFRKIVMEIKDHPALLLWGIGNEVDLFYTNTNVWKAVNDIAKMIHEVDPNHPTSTPPRKHSVESRHYLFRAFFSYLFSAYREVFFYAKYRLHSTSP